MLVTLIPVAGVVIGFLGKFYYRPGKGKSFNELIGIMNEYGEKSVKENKQTDIEIYWTARVACCVEFGYKLGKELSSVHTCDKCKNLVPCDNSPKEQCLIKKLLTYTTFMFSQARDPAFYYYNKGPR
jgi:hypothetical protein